MTVTQRLVSDDEPAEQKAKPAKHENFIEALAASQLEFTPVKKNRTAKVKGESKRGTPFEYTYKYADLGDVLSMCLPIFARHGIAVSQPLKMVTSPTGSEQIGRA